MAKNSPLYPFVKKVRSKLKSYRIKKSKLYTAKAGKAIAKLNTNDSYSHGWFYPRYSNGELHEKEITLKFLQEAMKSRVIVDVGANLGWFTCLAAKANRESIIYSFELDSDNFELCRRNIALNELANVRLENMAASSSDGHVLYSKESQGASATHRIGSSMESEKKVPSCMLDTYFQGKQLPNLIKIDVEGAEQLVLEGMNKILNSTELKTVFIEIHPQWLSELNGSVSQTFEHLERAGFSVLSMRHRSSGIEESKVSIDELEQDNVGDRMLIARRLS